MKGVLCWLIVLSPPHPCLPVLQEEAIPELEIDVDELLDMPSDVERAARVKVRYPSLEKIKKLYKEENKQKCESFFLCFPGFTGGLL